MPLSQTVQFLSRLTVLAAGGGIDTGELQLSPSSVERLTRTVGTTPVGSSGMELISQAPSAASKATEGSLTASYGLPVAPDVEVRPGRKPGSPQVAPPSPERAKPMSVEPPLTNRPTWNVATTVLPAAKVSGSTSVACWLVEFVNGSLLTRVSVTLAVAAPTGAAKTAATATTAAPADDFQYL